MQPDLREYLLKKAAIALLIIMVITIPVAYLIPVAENAYYAKKEAILTQQNREREKLLSMSGTELIENANETTEGYTLKEQTIEFKLPLGCKGENVKVEEDQKSRQCVVSLPYADENYFLDRTVTGDTSVLKDASYEYVDRVGYLTLSLDRVYEYFTEYSSDTFTISFKTPKQLYDKIVLVDAGSGGNDTGVNKYNIDEKNINLDICLKLKELLQDVNGVGFYYTRLDDETITDEERYEFAKDIEADLVVSIQMNHTPSGMMSTINGTQVAYKEDSEESKALAEEIKDSIVADLFTSDKGVKPFADDDIWKDYSGMAIIVKPGFMTNTGDLELLSTDGARHAVAADIYKAVAALYE
ncbi:MAG: N-acetylmuramoyl-L-alanine amidase [Lachnospiraceae bacterium]|nr:N-acetylmuramoyl-L-alanine amidase [Lachnospiraceae bacterium]